MVPKELHLGTANFAMPYGIANKSPMKPIEAKEILNWCKGRIECIDYAPEYKGAAELLTEFCGSYRVTTKVDFSSFKTAHQLEKQLMSQLVTMKLQRFNHVLVRFSREYFPIHQDFWGVLQDLKASGYCESLGFSVYQPSDVLQAINVFTSIDIFQVPENLLNRKFSEFATSHPHLSNQVKFVVRSIFLQGLFFMKQDEIPSNLAPLIPSLIQLQKEAMKQECSLSDLAIAYSKQLTWSSGTVIGVNSLEQAKSTYQAFQDSQNRSLEFLHDLKTLPEELTDPRSW